MGGSTWTAEEKSENYTYTGTVTPIEYTIKINEGKASIGAGTEITKAKVNDVITITANVAAEGKEFTGWTVVSGNITLAGASKETTTFTMPGEAVEITATYKDKPVTPPHEHDFSGSWQRDDAAHWHKCPDDEATDTKAAHEYDDEADTTCNVCGYERTVTPPAPVAYTITKGNGQTVTKGNTANFVSNAPFEKFDKVQVDGVDVATSNYTVISGSTDVTFTADYINGLSEGSHTIAIVSNDGQATGSFIVKAATGNTESSKPGGNTNPSDGNKVSSTGGNTTSPQTGDNSNIALWGVLMMLSASGIAFTVYSRKRKLAKKLTTLIQWMG